MTSETFAALTTNSQTIPSPSNFTPASCSTGTLWNGFHHARYKHILPFTSLFWRRALRCKTRSFYRVAYTSGELPGRVTLICLFLYFSVTLHVWFHNAGSPRTAYFLCENGANVFHSAGLMALIDSCSSNGCWHRPVFWVSHRVSMSLWRRLIGVGWEVVKVCLFSITHIF